MNILKRFSILLLFVFMHAFSMDQPYSVILEGTHCFFNKIEKGIFIAGSCIIGMNSPSSWLIGTCESKQTYVVDFSQGTQERLKNLYKNKKYNTDYMIIIDDKHFSIRKVVDLNSKPKIINKFPKMNTIAF